MTPNHTTQYQFSTLTTTAPDAVLDGIAAIELPDSLCINERGSTYLVIGPQPSSYDARLAVALATLVALAVLIIAAFSVVMVAFLPLAVVPLVPLVLRDHPLLAVGAVPEDEGSTRVTVHGQAPTRLTTALDLFLSRLPVAEPAHSDLNGNGHEWPHPPSPPVAPAQTETVRAPEATKAD